MGTYASLFQKKPSPQGSEAGDGSLASQANSPTPNISIPPQQLEKPAKIGQQTDRTENRSEKRTEKRSENRTDKALSSLPVKRSTKRYSFEFYDDQITRLKQLKRLAEDRGESLTLSSIARDAFDHYLKNKT